MSKSAIEKKGDFQRITLSPPNRHDNLPACSECEYEGPSIVKHDNNVATCSSLPQV